MAELKVSSEHQRREDAWLVLHAQAGDRAALEVLLERAYTLLQPYARIMIDDEDLRGDVLQEILVLVFRKLASLREPRAFRVWVRRIASREIFRTLRRVRHHEQTREELSPDMAAEPDDPLAFAGVMECLPSLLERVSPASRAVIALHYLEGLTLDEVGAVLALPIGTVKSRLAYGLTLLRPLLQADGR
jgi:RNA polymerase sigma-70 factor (ECF subfamily)